MKAISRPRIAMAIVLLIGASMFGCNERVGVQGNPSRTAQSNNDAVFQDIARLQREAAFSTPPQPVIALPELEGWFRSEPRSLPPEDHGFTVAYDHESGVAVTFYQYTRDYGVIPDDLDSGPPQNELVRAKTGIQQAVELGMWQAATETEQGIVPLGDSVKKALWSRHILTVNGEAVASDTYIWSHANTLFKLRCTGRPQRQEEDTKIVAALLTQFGNACSGKAK